MRRTSFRTFYIFAFTTTQRKIRAILQMRAAMAYYCNNGYRPFGKITARKMYPSISWTMAQQGLSNYLVVSSDRVTKRHNARNATGRKIEHPVVFLKDALQGTRQATVRKRNKKKWPRKNKQMNVFTHANWKKKNEKQSSQVSSQVSPGS